MGISLMTIETNEDTPVFYRTVTADNLDEVLAALPSYGMDEQARLVALALPVIAAQVKALSAQGGA